MIKKSLLIVISNEFFITVLGTLVDRPKFWSDEKDTSRFVHSDRFFKKMGTLLSVFNSGKYVLYNNPDVNLTLGSSATFNR